MLLEREEVNPNQANTTFGKTPLLRAAEKGHKEVVKMLLEREDVNPNQADIEYGLTPLLLAAEKAHEGVVNMLSVFPTVQGPDGARRTDCQEPWTGRDDRICTVPVPKMK